MDEVDKREHTIDHYEHHSEHNEEHHPEHHSPEHPHSPQHHMVHVPEHPHKKSNFTEKIRTNPWMISSLILGVLVIILLVATFSGGLAGGTVTKEKAASNLITYLNTVADSPITLVDVAADGNMYLATISYKNQSIPVYLTKDGNYYTTTMIPILTNSTSNPNNPPKETAVPKSVKPLVELYVFSYCPYGLQMEKAMLPVVSALGSNIDFKIRQIGAMHGPFEETEAIRQLSIEALYPDKYLAYVSAFAEDTSCPTGNDTCVATKVNAIYTKLGMDASKINAYMVSNGQNLYTAEMANAQSNGVTGSPTLIINGVTAQPSSRSPEAIKGIICGAFSSVPSACTQALSTSQASAGFGGGTSTSSSSASCN